MKHAESGAIGERRPVVEVGRGRYGRLVREKSLGVTQDCHRDAKYGPRRPQFFMQAEFAPDLALHGDTV